MPQLTERHKAYNLMLNDRENFPVLATGCPGTSKTYGAVSRAITWLSEGKQQKVVISKPNESFTKSLGATKGDYREKVAGWVEPIVQLFIEQGFNRNKVESAEKHGNLVFQPLELIQGYSFHDSLFIVDECENLTFKQLQMIVTRMGQHSKLVLCGDVEQVSPYFKNSGLAEFRKMCLHLDLPIHTVEFTEEDILRSDLCKQFMIGFNKWNNLKSLGEV